MCVVEENRHVIQGFLAPELREMRGQFAILDKRLDLIEEGNRTRHENIVQRLEFIRQYFQFDKRLSAIEADKRQSA